MVKWERRYDTHFNVTLKFELQRIIQRKRTNWFFTLNNSVVVEVSCNWNHPKFVYTIENSLTLYCGLLPNLFKIDISNKNCFSEWSSVDSVSISFDVNGKNFCCNFLTSIIKRKLNYIVRNVKCLLQFSIENSTQTPKHLIMRWMLWLF